MRLAVCVLPGRGGSLQSRRDVSPYLCACFLCGAPVDSDSRLGGNLSLLLSRSRRNVTTTHQRVYTRQGEADLRGLQRIGQNQRLTYLQLTTSVTFLFVFIKESPTFFLPDGHSLSPALSLFSPARSFGSLVRRREKPSALGRRKAGQLA